MKAKITFFGWKGQAQNEWKKRPFKKGRIGGFNSIHKRNGWTIHLIIFKHQIHQNPLERRRKAGWMWNGRRWERGGQLVSKVRRMDGYAIWEWVITYKTIVGLVGWWGIWMNWGRIVARFRCFNEIIGRTKWYIWLRLDEGNHIWPENCSINLKINWKIMNKLENNDLKGSKLSGFAVICIN